MLEKLIETRLVGMVEANGGMCVKFVSPGCSGVPDRIIMLPGGRIAFAETKAPGKVERPRQLYFQNMLELLGFKVFSSVDGDKKIAQIERWIKNGV